jgi:hypothetical protein
MSSSSREGIDSGDLDHFLQTAPRQQSGVYTLLFQDSSLPVLNARVSATPNPSAWWTAWFRELQADILSGLPAAKRLFADLYLLMPRRQLLVYFAIHTFTATQDAVRTALTTAMLSAVSILSRTSWIYSRPPFLIDRRWYPW